MNAIAVMVVLVVVVTVNVVVANTQSNMATDLGDISRFFKSFFQDENMEFAQTWVDNYQGTGDKTKRNNANDILDAGIDVPEDAMQSLIKAGYIFDGDMDFNSDTIIDNMSKIGMIESGYKSKRQQTDDDKKGERTGVARGYWQVEPATAKSLLVNSSPLFGPKFNKEFARYGDDGKSASASLASMSNQEIGQLIENDTDLAAAFATAKMITTF